MEEVQASAEPKPRAWAYLPDLLLLPLATFLGAVGLHPGPYHRDDAVAVLGLGIGAVIVALGGGLRLMRGIRLGVQPFRILPILSFGLAALTAVAGWVYASQARNYIHYITHHGH